MKGTPHKRNLTAALAVIAGSLSNHLYSGSGQKEVSHLLEQRIRLVGRYHKPKGSTAALKRAARTRKNIRAHASKRV